MKGNPIGLSSFVIASPFRDASLKALGLYRDMGYDLVEVCLEDEEDVTPEALVEGLHSTGLSASVGGVFGDSRDMSHEDPEVRRNARAYLTKCIEFAHAVGATVVSGPMYAAIGRTQLLDPAARHAQRMRAVEALKEVADVAAERGVSLSIEPLNRFETDLVNTVEQGLELCDLIGAPNVGLTLDTFHMNIEERDLPDAIRSAGARLVSFQASENDRGTPGSGHVDWSGVFAALAEIDYSGPVIVESFDADSADIARAVSLWRPTAQSMDDLARLGAQFLRQNLARPA